MTRLEQIDRVMQELEQCRADSNIGAAIGELDWLAELHRLLHSSRQAAIYRKKRAQGKKDRAVNRKANMVEHSLLYEVTL